MQRSNMDLAAFHASRGAFSEAIKYGLKAKEHCADNYQNGIVSASLVEWACMISDWGTVTRNLERVDGLGSGSSKCVISL